MTIGVICHLSNPTLEQAEELAVAAEQAGADWVGFPDAFWWRDTWLLLASAARATATISVGPMVTNPYLRHPFHTVAAAATLQEIAGPRVFVGLAAGGSEVPGAASVSRRDAPARVEALAALLRSVCAGGPLDERSGRRLDVPLRPVSITVAGRADAMLRAAGRVGDHALLWAVPDSDLDRSVGVIRSGGGADLVWAPLIAHTDADWARARVIAAYGVLNASPMLRTSWGIGDELAGQIRTALVAGGAEAAVELVPACVLADIVLGDPAPAVAAARARSIGATSLAFPAFNLADVAPRVAWCRAVLG